MERIKLQQRELDIIAFDQCRWHIGNDSEECVESWKAGYLFAMKELGQDVGELKVEIDDYEKLARTSEDLRFYPNDHVIIEANGDFKRNASGITLVYGVPVDDILKEDQTGVRCLDLPIEKQREILEELKNM